jgi:hypothetical protein
MKNWNLYLSGVWLVLGVALLLWHGTHPDDPTFRLRGTDWSPGWAGVVLAVYNLVRWYSLRAAGRANDRGGESSQRLPDDKGGRRPIHPEFDFDSREASNEEKRRRAD